MSIDFGFLDVNSKNCDCVRNLLGPEDEKCYILIADQYSWMLFGRCFVQKTPPAEFLDNWLHIPHPRIVNIPNKYVCMDLGSELGLSHKVDKVFKKCGNSIEQTAPHSSVSNAPMEHPHQTVADGI